MRTKRVFVVTIAFALTTISAACVVDDPEATGEQEALAIIEPVPQQGPPRLPRHDEPPHRPRGPDEPAYPAPYSPCIECHNNIPPPKPRPTIPTSCLRCHDPHNGNYPPGPGKKFPPGDDYELDPICLACHTRIDPEWPDPDGAGGAE